MFCLRAEDVRADSESRRRVSWAMSASLCSTDVRLYFYQDDGKITLPFRECLEVVLQFAVLLRKVFGVYSSSRHTVSMYGIAIPSAFLVSTQA